MMIKPILSEGRQVQRSTTHRSADPKALTRKILIANPRLEFPPTHTKQSPLRFSNREYIAVFQFFPLRRKSKNHSRPLRPVGPSLPTRNAGGTPALLTSAPVVPPTAAKVPCRSSSPTNHNSPVTSHAFLIYGAAIRNPRKPLKT